MQVCKVHGPIPHAEEQTRFLDDENVRHYDGRCATDVYGGQLCAVCYDHAHLPKNYTRADIEAYLRYQVAEEAHYLAEQGCSCTPSDLLLAFPVFSSKTTP